MSDDKSVAICGLEVVSGSKAEAPISRRYSVEEVLARRLNGWSGWRCAAGVENLHITPEGNLFSATCKVNGYLGNIFEGKLMLPSDWISCTKEWCMCGSDMQIRKARAPEFIAATQNPLPPVGPGSGQEAFYPQWVAPAQYEAHRSFPKTITWDLSRRCNFSCSYCHPSVSNQFESHHSWGSLQEAVERIDRKFCAGTPTKWVFTGGEPTINPVFMELVRRIKSSGHLIHVQSNGSRGPEFFRELIREACVGLSLHLESLNLERFIETCAAVVDEKTRNETAGHMWFGVRIMVPPGEYIRAQEIRQRLLEIPNFAERAAVNMSPLYQRLKQDQLMEYATAELKQIQQMA